MESQTPDSTQTDANFEAPPSGEQSFMTRVVYTSEPHIPASRLVNPYWIVRDLYKHRELIAAYTKREFQAVHRGTYLGLAWSVLSPLIMLGLFAFVFGYIFGGKFNPKAHETPAEFALALFVGLGFFNCFGQSMGAASGLVLANAAYVKTLAFPLEILPVSSVLSILTNLSITLLICFVAHLMMYGHLRITTVWLLAHIVCIMLISLGISWFLASLSVFIRDIPTIVPPISMVLMFISGCFFPLSGMSPRIRPILELNPLAVIIDQARACLMYGQAPDGVRLAYVFIFSLMFAICGYYFFMKAKPAFADVI
jgi:lipopolysaccharide transport system permease protein